MSYSTIDKPSDYFNTKLYTGNGTDNHAITGVGFEPDWTWIKNRGLSGNHMLYDIVRGATKALFSNDEAAENTSSGHLKSFDSDGFTLGDNSGTGSTNGNNETYVAWNWLGANGTASNSDGSITSTVSANTTAGFSIVSYTGNGSNATIGHGLGVTPKTIIVKKRNTTSGGSAWFVNHGSLSATQNVYLNDAAAVQSDNVFASRGTSTFGITSSTGINNSGDTFIAYCFAEKQGYSKFGSYLGNANADGTFVYTGFKPAFVMIKQTTSATYWHIYDNKRSSSGGSNVINDVLYPNRSDAEYSEDRIDFVSNGFKIRTTNEDINKDGNTFIYMAFAESPFVGSNFVPNNAR